MSHEEDLIAVLTRIADALERGGAAAPSGAAPAYPGGTCPDHGSDWKYVGPGVSKRTGNPYAGFWTCPERGCDERPGGAKRKSDGYGF